MEQSGVNMRRKKKGKEISMHWFWYVYTFCQNISVKCEGQSGLNLFGNFFCRHSDYAFLYFLEQWSLSSSSSPSRLWFHVDFSHDYSTGNEQQQRHCKVHLEY